jgi:uncharacterized protein (TIGR00251 family)
VRFAVRLTPRARAERIDGVAAGALKVSVTAPATENRANEALLRLLAQEWRLARSAVSIVRGARSRDKLVDITGDPDDLMRRLCAALATLAAR